jgi:hypothetical protein
MVHIMSIRGTSDSRHRAASKRRPERGPTTGVTPAGVSAGIEASGKSDQSKDGLRSPVQHTSQDAPIAKHTPHQKDNPSQQGDLCLR